MPEPPAKENHPAARSGLWVHLEPCLVRLLANKLPQTPAAHVVIRAVGTMASLALGIVDGLAVNRATLRTNVAEGDGRCHHHRRVLGVVDVHLGTFDLDVIYVGGGHPLFEHELDQVPSLGRGQATRVVRMCVVARVYVASASVRHQIIHPLERRSG
jgi:hypothetical protein